MLQWVCGFGGTPVHGPAISQGSRRPCPVYRLAHWMGPLSRLVSVTLLTVPTPHRFTTVNWLFHLHLHFIALQVKGFVQLACI